jgi:hypothetical protein
VLKNNEEAMRIKWTKLYVDDQEKALAFCTDKLTQLICG